MSNSNGVEFMTQELFRVGNTMRELVGTLASASHPSLSSKIDFPSVVQRDETYITLDMMCACAAGKEIYLVEPKKGAWEVRDVTPRRHRYRSLALFGVESVPYLAAGYSSGIVVINLREREQKKVNVEIAGRAENVAFSSLGVIGSGLDTLLLAVHPLVGFINVPLARFLHDDVVTVNRSNVLLPPSTERKWLSQIRSTTEGVYVSHERDILHTDASLRPFDPILSFPAMVCCFDVKEREVYCGTEGGIVYHNSTRLCRTAHPVISAVQAGVYEGREGVFFQGKKRSAVYFTDGDKIMPVSKSPLDTVAGFHMGTTSFVLEKNLTSDHYELTILGNESRIVIPVQGKGRVLTVYGGDFNEC